MKNKLLFCFYLLGLAMQSLAVESLIDCKEVIGTNGHVVTGICYNIILHPDGEDSRHVGFKYLDGYDRNVLVSTNSSSYWKFESAYGNYYKIILQDHELGSRFHYPYNYLARTDIINSILQTKYRRRNVALVDSMAQENSYWKLEHLDKDYYNIILHPNGEDSGNVGFKYLERWNCLLKCEKIQYPQLNMNTNVSVYQTGHGKTSFWKFRPVNINLMRSQDSKKYEAITFNEKVNKNLNTIGVKMMMLHSGININDYEEYDSKTMVHKSVRFEQEEQ